MKDSKDSKDTIEVIGLNKHTYVIWSEYSCCEKQFKKVTISNSEVNICVYGRCFKDKYTFDEIVDLFLKQKYCDLMNISGSLSFVIIYEGTIYLYTGNAQANPFYLYKRNGRIYISDDYEAIAAENKVALSNRRLALLCWGGNCLPYDDFLVLKSSAVYKINRDVELIWKYTSIVDKSKVGFEKICVDAKQNIELAVADCLNDEKIALALSGGIDSSVLAICLKGLGANFECFHWTSNDFASIDERRYAEELCNKYDIRLNLIDISEGIRNSDYINTQKRFYLPYNHSSFSWWERTVEAAVEHGCKRLFSGLNGDGLFSTPFTLLGIGELLGDDFWWKLKYWLNSFGIPDKSFYQVEEGKTKRSLYEYNFLRRAEFINDLYLQERDARSQEEVFIQKESLRMNLFDRYKIECVNPYLEQNLIDFCSKIPRYFKCIPVSGRIVQKPVLKMAFKEELPFSIFSRNSKSNFGILSQKYCEFNDEYIVDFLSKNSELEKRGIIFGKKLRDVMKEKNKLYQNSYSLIRSCFIECWLRQRGEKNV